MIGSTTQWSNTSYVELIYISAIRYGLQGNASGYSRSLTGTYAHLRVDKERY
jgi:hypothetical protein